MFDGTCNECLPKRMNDATKDKEKTPIWQKYTLTIDETADYFRIGENKLRQIVNENPEAPFVLWNGTRAQIKRTMFEQYIDKINII